MKKVDGHSSLIRDDNTNAILNTNSVEYNNYLQRRAKRQQGQNRIDTMEDDLKSLKDDINEIKNFTKSTI